MNSNTFKKGEKVIMEGCYEATFPENKNKIWTCQTDSYIDKGGQDVVFLEGFSGCFACKYLKLAKGFYLIMSERKRQIEVEGYKLEDDKKYKNNELFLAASCYSAARRNRAITYPPQDPYEPPNGWPFAKEYWKPTPDNPVRELIKAGALFRADFEATGSLLAMERADIAAAEIDNILNRN